LGANFVVYFIIKNRLYNHGDTDDNMDALHPAHRPSDDEHPRAATQAGLETYTRAPATTIVA